MKKKYLIAILPALLVLSSCQAAPKAEVLKEDNFIEDTEAHDEIFGSQSFGHKVAPYHLGSDPVEHPDNDPAIGVQTKIEGENISFRFVAAVTFTNENIGPTHATWKRTVSKPDGQVHMDTNTIECTKAYTKLGTDGDPYTIDQFNAAQEPATSYTHFVVYTLRGINLATYGDYYISAYLTLTDGVEQTSKAIVTTVDTSIYQAAYIHNLGDYSVAGTFNGTPNVIPATSIRGNAEAKDKATFEGLSIKKDDTLVINEFYDTKMYVKNVANFTGDDNHSGYYFADESNEMKANFDGTYNLFLTKDDQIYTTASNVVSNGPLYVDVNVSWWGNDSAWTSVYAYSGELGDNTGKWFALTGTFWGNVFRTSTEDNFFTAANYAAGYTHIAVCRLKNGTNLPVEIAKHIENEIWELRPGNNRIFFFFYCNGTYVLLHHYRKKSQKTPQKEISRAKAEMKDYISRKER